MLAHIYHLDSGRPCEKKHWASEETVTKVDLLPLHTDAHMHVPTCMCTHAHVCTHTHLSHVHTQHRLSIPYHCASNQNEFRFISFVYFAIFVHLMKLLEDEANIEYATEFSFIHTSHPLPTIILCDIFRASDMNPSVKISTWCSKFFGFWHTWDWGPSR